MTLRRADAMMVLNRPVGWMAGLNMESLNSLYLILFLISLVAAAFFCSAETAFIGMQRLRLKHLIHTNHPKAKIVARIVERPEKFLATVLLCINFFETAVATLGTVIAVSLWGENLGAAIATIVITILTKVQQKVTILGFDMLRLYAHKC